MQDAMNNNSMSISVGLKPMMTHGESWAKLKGKYERNKI